MSSPSTSPRPPERYEFFVDECVAPRHVSAVLREAGHAVHVQGPATFGTGTPDVDWLPKVGQRGWVLITKDKSIRKRQLELRALLNAGVRAFVLTAGGLKGEQQGLVFTKALPAMLRILAVTPAPFIARVTALGNVDIIDVSRYIDSRDSAPKRRDTET